MTTTSVNADSILAIDIGSVNTRATLFDVVENQYRFLGTGSAPSTIAAPFKDAREGVRLALDELHDITGRILTGGDGNLLIPSQADGSGVDKCVVTVSGGPPLRVVAVGLLEDISAASAQNLAATTYAQVVELLHLNDRRNASSRLDAVLRSHPDLVILAGGTEDGASQSVLRLLEAVGLACYVLPNEEKPEILYVGNKALTEEVKSSVGELANLTIAPNIRPTLEIEQLGPAQPQLSEVFRQARIRKIVGMEALDRWSGGRLMPSAAAFGRVIRYISAEFARTKKGVLGVDIGSASTTVAAAFGEELVLNVQPKLGIGENLPGLLQVSSLEEITRWLSLDISANDVQDYIYNKAFVPASLPSTLEDLDIEHALATTILRVAVQKASRSFPEAVRAASRGLLPLFEPIVASGKVLTHAPHRGQTLLMLLNGLQPTGTSLIFVDQHNLVAALGAAAAVDPLLTVQAMDATNFLNLCTVVSPVGEAHFGTPILRARLTFGDGSETNIEVKYGSLDTIQVPPGQTANLHLQPLHHFDVGLGPGRGGGLKITGGLFGLVIDARGRPIALPADPARAREMLKKWYWILGINT